MTWNNWREKAIKKYPDIEQEYQALALKKSLLHFAIEQKAIPVKEYLPWAQKEFQLASLKLDFKPSDKNKLVWNQWSTLGLWNQSCFPFYEWDQCLYVLSLEPFTQTRIKNHQVISILSTPEKINELWNYYHSEQELLLESLEDSESTDTENSESETQEMPEGFGDLPALRIKSSNTSDEDDFLQTVAIQPAPIALNLKAESPTALEKTQVIEDLDEDVPPSTQLIDLKTISKQMPTLDDEEDVPPSTQRIDLAKLGLTAPNFQPPQGTAESTPVSASIKAPRTYPDYYLLDALQKKFPQEVHGKLEQIFKTLNTSYQKSLVFCVNKAETECQIFKLDSSFHPEIRCDIKLKEPSIFRIMQKTGKSFHGALASSKVNDEMVQKLFMGRKPEIFTGSPLLVAGTVVGYILSVGPSTAYNPQGLALSEDLCFDFSRTLEQLAQMTSTIAS